MGGRSVVVIVLALAMVVMVRGQNMPRQMTVAAIFDQGGDMKYELAFKHAVQMINQNRCYRQTLKFSTEECVLATFFVVKIALLCILGQVPYKQNRLYRTHSCCD